jgi:hypothetical protein
MTTIAYREGIMAADSGATTTSDAGGTRKSMCRKLYRKFVVLHSVADAAGKPKPGVRVEDVIIGIAGEGFAGLQFIDQLYSQKPDEQEDIKSRLIVGDADFSAIVLTRKGLFEYDRWCRYEGIIDPYYAIGSGAKAALGAMWMGASARESVEAAITIDPFTFGTIVAARLLSGAEIASLQPGRTPLSAKLAEDAREGLIEIETNEVA